MKIFKKIKMKIINIKFVLMVLIFISIYRFELYAVNFYSKQGHISVTLSNEWKRTSNYRLNEVNNIIKKNNFNFSGFTDGFNLPSNPDIYIWVQKIKGSFEPHKVVKEYNLIANDSVFSEKLTNKANKVNNKIYKINFGKTVFIEQFGILLSKLKIKRKNTTNLIGHSFSFFLKNQITMIHCYYPENDDYSREYLEAMSRVKIDKNFLPDDSWNKIFYSLLGLKFMKRKRN